MNTWKRLSALLAAGALAFFVIGTASAGTDYGHESSEPSFEQSSAVETDEPSQVVETEEASFEQSQEVETEEPSFEQSEEVETEEPSFEQSQEGETDEPSFEQSQEGETDIPSLPDTATIGGTNTAAPTDGAWLLVVALGVILASIVVLTPARAKAPRR